MNSASFEYYAKVVFKKSDETAVWLLWDENWVRRSNEKGKTVLAFVKKSDYLLALSKYGKRSVELGKFDSFCFHLRAFSSDFFIDNWTHIVGAALQQLFFFDGFPFVVVTELIFVFLNTVNHSERNHNLIA